MKKRILVTGGTGFLGSNVVELFKKLDNYEVYSCSRKEGIDIRDYENFSRFVTKIKPEILVHCAAHVGGIAYDAMHPVEVFEDNIKIGINTVKVVAENNIKYFINIMPNCTYPAKYDEYIEENWWNGEMHPSVVVYGFPRKMMQVACFAYLKKYNFKVVHLILPNMYGPGDHFDPVRSHAFGALIAKIVNAKKDNEKTVEIWGTGRPVREWLYVKDGAEAILKALGNIDKIDNNDILNIGTNKGISIADLAEMIKKEVGWQGEFVFNTSKPDGAISKTLSAVKMKKYLNWEPTTNLKDGIKKTINALIKHK